MTKLKQKIKGYILNKKFGKIIPISNYMVQSLMAMFFLMCFFSIWNLFIPISNQIIFTAIASSTFLTFVSTNIYESLASKIIVGQAIGVIIGVILWNALSISSTIFVENYNELLILFLSLSTGFTLLSMAIFGFEHPPAAGTAMALVYNQQSPLISDILFIIICAILLALTHKLLKKRHLLKNLN